MTVRIEKDGAVWTVIHDRPEARNAMDPASAETLTAAFLEFDADESAAVAVFYGAGGSFCAGWDLKYVSTLDVEHPLGELDIPTAGPHRGAAARRRLPGFRASRHQEPDEFVLRRATVRARRVVGWLRRGDASRSRT